MVEALYLKYNSHFECFTEELKGMFVVHFSSTPNEEEQQAYVHFIDFLDACEGELLKMWKTEL